MSAYSTLNISRDAALSAIQHVLNVASNQDLEDILFNLLKDKTLYNYSINHYGTEDNSILEGIIKEVY